MAIPAVRLSPQVWRIPTTPFDLVNSFALVDDDGQVTLVDCGLKRAPARIVAGLAAMGKAPADVTRIVLTHAHVDHVGGLAEIVDRSGADVAVHRDDADYVRKGVPPPVDGSTTMGRLLARGPTVGFAPAFVDRLLEDDDVLDIAGGVRVIHTPGHTPGHVSLLHEPSGVLITGDSLFNIRRVRWPIAFACTDAEQARRTARRFVDLEYTMAAFTHGPEIRHGAREVIRSFLRIT